MRALALAIVAATFGAGCGGDAAVGEMRLALTGGLSAADIGSVEVLVLGGPSATCARALAPQSPLDDPELTVVAHALFTFDGTAKHLAVPADEALVFYAEAFHSPDGERPRIGRGCAEGELAGGHSGGVTIDLTTTN
jgi:hypothetical protein